MGYFFREILKAGIHLEQEQTYNIQEIGIWKKDTGSCFRFLTPKNHWGHSKIEHRIMISTDNLKSQPHFSKVSQIYIFSELHFTSVVIENIILKPYFRKIFAMTFPQLRPSSLDYALDQPPHHASIVSPVHCRSVIVIIVIIVITDSTIIINDTRIFTSQPTKGGRERCWVRICDVFPFSTAILTTWVGDCHAMTILMNYPWLSATW